MANTDLIATDLLRIQNQLKVYHWQSQTNQYRFIHELDADFESIEEFKEEILNK